MVETDFGLIVQCGLLVESGFFVLVQELTEHMVALACGVMRDISQNVV